MSLWLHELSEANHSLLNPFSQAKLDLVADLCGVGPDTRILDLASGKGEMLCQWADRYGSSGHGVDLSEVFLAAAAERAAELGVADRVTFEHGDAGKYRAEDTYDLVSCIGATWIGGGLAGTLDLMRPAVKPDGLLVVGDVYWNEPPTDEACQAMSIERDEFATLEGTLGRFERAGTDLVEMVLANGDDWDRYAAPQWWALTEWLRANPDDPRRDEVREFRDRARSGHLAHRKRYMGWGVFVLRPEIPA